MRSWRKAGPRSAKPRRVISAAWMTSSRPSAASTSRPARMPEMVSRKAAPSSPAAFCSRCSPVWALACSSRDRLSAPARRLAEHAEAIGSGGELTPLLDPAVNARADELGKLARAFNRMIGELAGARQRLIDWSEAEIRTQYRAPQRRDQQHAARPVHVRRRAKADHLQQALRRDLFTRSATTPTPGTPLRKLIEDHVTKGTQPEPRLMRIMSQSASRRSRGASHTITLMNCATGT